MSVSDNAKRLLSAMTDNCQERPCFRLSEVAGYEPFLAELLSAGFIARTRLGRYPAIQITDSGLAAQAQV